MGPPPPRPLWLLIQQDSGQGSCKRNVSSNWALLGMKGMLLIMERESGQLWASRTQRQPTWSCWKPAKLQGTVKGQQGHRPQQTPARGLLWSSHCAGPGRTLTTPILKARWVQQPATQQGGVWTPRDPQPLGFQGHCSQGQARMARVA